MKYKITQILKGKKYDYLSLDLDIKKKKWEEKPVIGAFIITLILLIVSLALSNKFYFMGVVAVILFLVEFGIIVYLAVTNKNEHPPIDIDNLPIEKNHKFVEGDIVSISVKHEATSVICLN